MRAASFNVLADAYTGYGDYSHVDPALMLPGARTQGIVRLIDELQVDVIGLQEAEEPLKIAVEESKDWQTFWSPKERGKADGCLTLVRHSLDVNRFDTHAYSDGSGHIVQSVQIGEVVFANTHIKWAPTDSLDHIGVGQAKELLSQFDPDQQAVIFADCNDRPKGPVRQLIEGAGFIHVYDDEPTALVNREPVALDLLAVRGITARNVTKQYDLTTIPNRFCPSDHIPIVAELEMY
jgi:endonuclease/exonuclease/phosphatase family metal-dependent hydrolase